MMFQCYLGRVFVQLKDEKGGEDFLETFKDTRWGQNYAPYDRSFVIEESTLFKIRDALKGQL